MTPTSGAAGIQVAIEGTGFGASTGENQVSLNNVALNGQRYYVEYEGLANPRGSLHEARILANDPGANFILRIVP